MNDNILETSRMKFEKANTYFTTNCGFMNSPNRVHKKVSSQLNILKLYDKVD
jgi:hypothetical protein